MDKTIFLDLIRGIAQQTVNLKNKYIEENSLPIDYLTIFPHSEEEFSEMKNTAVSLGEVIDENNGPVYRFNKPLDIPTGQLKFFRIRKPDPQRPQKGCVDFRVKNFEEFKKKYLEKFKEDMSLIKRPDYEMIEIKDERYDVLVYFPSIYFSEVLSQK